MHGKRTVLLVEDESALLQVSRHMLQKSGFEVLATTSPLEARRLAAEHPGPIHLLITDVMMPEMSGAELWQAVRVLRPQMLGLFVSGYAPESLALPDLSEPGLNFLAKPFSFEQLSRKIGELLPPLGCEP